MRERRWAEMRRKFAGTFRKVGTTQRHVPLHLKSQPNSTVPSLSFPEFSSLLSLNCIVLVWLSRKAKAHSPSEITGIWPCLKHSFSQMQPRLPFPSLFSCNNRNVCVCYLLSYVWLFVMPWIEAYQALLAMGSSRQEYWSGCHFLLQGIFLTQESNLRLLHCSWILYCLSRQGSSITEI